MRIVLERIGGGPKTLEAFADDNGFTMKVYEMFKGATAKYSAHFERVEIMERGCLVTSCGYGDTPEQAISDYAKEIAGKRLAYQAYTPDRREVQAPNEWLQS